MESEEDVEKRVKVGFKLGSSWEKRRVWGKNLGFILYHFIFGVFYKGKGSLVTLHHKTESLIKPFLK